MVSANTVSGSCGILRILGLSDADATSTLIGFEQIPWSIPISLCCAVGGIGNLGRGRVRPHRVLLVTRGIVLPTA